MNLTKKDFAQNKTTLTHQGVETDENLSIEGGLGTVHFTGEVIANNLHVGAGTSVSSAYCIRTKGDIMLERGDIASEREIISGESITASNIRSGRRIQAAFKIEATGKLEARLSITTLELSITAKEISCKNVGAGIDRDEPCSINTEKINGRVIFGKQKFKWW